MQNMVYNRSNKRGAYKCPPLSRHTDTQMPDIKIIILLAKYIIATALIIAIIMYPAWLARQNGRGKPDMHAVRLASWVFGWSIIGWLWSLYWATKK